MTVSGDLLLKYDFGAVAGPLVHLMQVDCAGPLHIGSVDNIVTGPTRSRLRKQYMDLQDHLPFPLCVLGVRVFPDMHDARVYEQHLRQRFAEFAIHNGWFCNASWRDEVVADFQPLPMAARARTLVWTTWDAPPEVRHRAIPPRRRRCQSAAVLWSKAK